MTAEADIDQWRQRDDGGERPPSIVIGSSS
jgi:hypothetical protein